jgi:hypothetical protein
MTKTPGFNEQKSSIYDIKLCVSVSIKVLALKKNFNKKTAFSVFSLKIFRLIFRCNKVLESEKLIWDYGDIKAGSNT